MNDDDDDVSESLNAGIFIECSKMCVETFLNGKVFSLFLCV